MASMPSFRHNSASFLWFPGTLNPPSQPYLLGQPPIGTSPPGPGVDLWLLTTERVEAADLEQLRACLAPAEQAQLQARPLLQAQQQFLLSRGCLRYLLSTYTGQPPDSLRFTYGPQGKPALEIATEQGTVPRFNLSHSGGRILIAVSGAEAVEAVGVDIEQVRSVRYLPQLCRRYFSAAEAEAILAAGAPGAEQRLLRYWTGKEAYLKALGLGIADSLAQLELVPSPQPLAVNLAPVAVSAPHLPQPPGLLYQWQPEPEYLAAVAVRSPSLAAVSFRQHSTTPHRLIAAAGGFEP